MAELTESLLVMHGQPSQSMSKHAMSAVKQVGLVNLVKDAIKGLGSCNMATAIRVEDKRNAAHADFWAAAHWLSAGTTPGAAWVWLFTWAERGV